MASTIFPQPEAASTNCLFCLINSPDPKIFSKQEIKSYIILYKQYITQVANRKRKGESREETDDKRKRRRDVL